MNSKKTKNTLLKSFKCAFDGIFHYLLKERNFRIHVSIAVLVIIAGFFFQITRMEWVAVLLLVAFVLSLEAINSCIERICDFISPGYDRRIKAIKDISAGFVLISAIISVVVGCIIFIPYIFALLQSFTL
ncbi:diacylglycerol kinase family protein [Bacteroidales bacterium OttesenSCG-928-A17]|nr:diacylglycerol kinase family protein [Bacteroidales bacterium OttesenSCG-928-A17]